MPMGTALRSAREVSGITALRWDFHHGVCADIGAYGYVHM